MLLVPRSSPRGRRLDLLAAHIAALDPDTERARRRLDHAIGESLAALLVPALARGRGPVTLGRARIAAAAA